MKKVNTPLAIVISLFAVCFALLLAYVALLGENGKIDSLIIGYFEKAKAQQYEGICNDDYMRSNEDLFSIDGECADNCFLLELALLSRYHLLTIGDYKPLVIKSHFWIPMFNDDTVKVSVLLANANEIGPFHFLKRKEDKHYVKDLFTVERKEGMWKIKQILLGDTAFARDFNELKAEFKIDDYFTRNGGNITLGALDIDVKNLSDIEKRKVNYILQKTSRMMTHSKTSEPSK